jgi:precorrin-2 dehydrogenase/sirohydrochlorin ferrochelatase
VASTAHYPVNLVLEGRSCLVAGAGAVGAQKVRGLLEAGAVVHVVAPEIGPEVAALAAETPERVQVDQRPYQSTDLDGCRLAIAATDDPATNHQVFLDGEAAGVWVNSADDPTNCAFTLPARIRQGPLLVTFSTGGTSPAVSSWLRRRFTQEFGPEYAELLSLLAEERAKLQADGEPTEGRDWQSALDSGMLDLIRSGHIAEAKGLLQSCLSSSSG